LHLLCVCDHACQYERDESGKELHGSKVFRGWGSF
jgi:hypothetical protein